LVKYPVLHLAFSFVFRVLVVTKETCVENIKGSDYYVFPLSFPVIWLRNFQSDAERHTDIVESVASSLFRALDGGGRRNIVLQTPDLRNRICLTAEIISYAFVVKFNCDC
jgi:hypothetical protein